MTFEVDEIELEAIPSGDSQIDKAVQGTSGIVDKLFKD